ncbi:MAG: type I restriction endonuclease subunit R, partial [Pseudomonadota bacterium]|nr:type I restriction endonuclease subunit R [Pseudomonadota bacterium]
ITDAIKDGNVLRFSVDYRKVKAVFDGTDVEAQNSKLLNDRHYLSSEKRIQKVVNDILAVHDNKTHDRTYTAMMCVNSVDELMSYYRLIKSSQESAESPLRIATIFSCNGNDNKEFDGVSETDGLEVKPDADDSRMNFLRDCVKDYNRDHGTSYDVRDSQDFYRYYQDISKRVRKQDIDILLVVNMFLTGFDSPTLNTLYVDKNLRHQGLIQAYSRTNRVFDVRKSHGNIVCYRDLKEATDEALMLFANRHSKGGDLDDVASVVIMSPYPDLKKQFNEKIKQLKEQTPTPDAVDDLVREEEQFQFLQTFRDVIRMKNALKTFPDYDDDLQAGKLEIDEQDLADFESKYSDKYNDIKRAEKEERDKKSKERQEEIKKLREEGKLTEAEQKEREHQLEIEAQMKSMQFDIELLDTAEINVEYILNLIE